MIEAKEYLDLTACPFPELFVEGTDVWAVLPRIAEFLAERTHWVRAERVSDGAYVDRNVAIGPGTVVEPGAVIKGPAIIGAHCEIRAHAYVRGNVIVGDHAVLGNACEFKNALLFHGANVPHFSYVGDSVLGHKAHLGAGAILSNVKSTSGTVRVRHESGDIETGLRKFGAIVGDGADIGCNCVLAPGSVIGRRTIIYPNVLWRGVCPAESIVKLRQQQMVISRRS
jgi:NDP-sugar pyrophosphorylase family protein